MEHSNQAKIKILAITDDKGLKKKLLDSLNEEYELLVISKKESALITLRREPIAAVVYDLEGENIETMLQGFTVLGVAKNSLPPIPVLAITDDLEKAVSLEAVRLGVYCLLEKPIKSVDFKGILRQAVRLWQLGNIRKRKDVELRNRKGFHRLIGTSQALYKLIKQARAVADTQATILITGESGTGKEILARAIHEESPRFNAPFLPVNVGAITPTLLESELFGYIRGSFTGATANRKGLFEAANNGTIFLDEISEMSADMQVRLLRVLQERTVRPVGSNEEIPITTRVIAATNRDLSSLVREGRFREDLFYRISVIPLVIPPLRQRLEDIPALAAHFATRAAELHNRPIPTLDSTIIEQLMGYDFPGNIRELENLIEHLVVLSNLPQLKPDHLPDGTNLTVITSNFNEASLFDSVDEEKARRIHQALKSAGGNTVIAARLLGISRSYLYRLLKQFDIRINKSR
jgi:DNA-binding NtrC family response regulator